MNSIAIFALVDEGDTVAILAHYMVSEEKPSRKRTIGEFVGADLEARRVPWGITVGRTFDNPKCCVKCRLSRVDGRRQFN